MMSITEMVLAVVGLVALSALTRSFFFLLDKPLTLPAWAERGLKYAPLAALAAVLAPEVLLVQGQWPTSWCDARFVAAPLAMAWAWWCKDMLSTIVVGMVVFLALRLGLGW
jgi:branched-subunit amino acid transport protein